MSSDHPGGLVDPRLLRRASVTRRFLALMVAVGLAETACVVVQAVAIGSAVGAVVLRGDGLRALEPQLGTLAGATIALAALAWLGQLAAHRTSATVMSLLRRQLLGHALDLGPAWLAGERTGSLAATATDGVQALDAFFARYLPRALLAGLAPVALVAWALVVDPVSGSILAVTAAVVPVLMVLLGLYSRREAEREWGRYAELGARFLDLVQGLPTLRAFRQVKAGRRAVGEASAALGDSAMRTLRIALLSSLVLELMASVGIALVALFLGLRLLAGTIPLGTAFAVLVVAPEVYLPLRRAGAEFHASAEGRQAAAGILDVLDAPAGPAHRVVASPAGAGVDATDCRVDGSARGSGSGQHTVPGQHAPGGPAVALHGVTVRYPSRHRPVLDDLDLSVQAGEHVAVVGPSGTGKSTLLGVLLGFVPVTRGEVSMTGLRLATADPGAWRRRVTWVPQRPYLVRGTLADNLRLGRPDAGRDAIDRVVALAGLEALVGTLPRGLDAPVGEGGAPLSAGERQRVAIGRAALRDAPVVLLDEPVANLDPAGVRALGESLEPWLSGRTVLVAAHRHGLLRRVDRVLSLAGSEGRTGGPHGAPVPELSA